ncbi:MAG: ACT domain-containing protein [Firmicutes bacterium]|nr:ACT domain-containing protein [Bacillota bacterium]
MKAIVTVIGVDKTGIIASVTTELARLGVNVEDISQTILQEYFVMLMMIESKKLDASEIGKSLEKLGEKVGVDIRVQNKELFDAMHRI